MKFPLLSLLCALSLTACAQSTSADDSNKSGAVASAGATATASSKPDPSAEKRVRAALKSIAPKFEIDHIGPAPLPGFQEVIASGQAIYISNDGRYIMQGALFDVQTKRDLSQLGLSVVRRAELDKVPVSDRIVFAPVGPAKYRVSVFTDIECGYCQKLHSQIAEYNRLGIAVEYLAFPRAGLNTPDSTLMESVWCSADRRQALTDAKNGRPVEPKQCDNPVAKQYALGQRLGLSGTPMIVNAEGIMLPGYMPPDAMLAKLDELAAETKADAGEKKTATADVAKADSPAGSR